jgi:hypothetical protein
MAEPCRVFEGPSAERRLAELGLTAEILQVAILAGEAEARVHTALDPPTAGGMNRYYRTVRVLREQLVPKGWHYDNRRHLARTINPDRSLAIVVALGDEVTGNPDPLVQPSTRHETGVTVEEAVATNIKQLALFDLPAPAALSDAFGGLTTWVLLRYPTHTEIRYELSLPSKIADRQITQWRERIVLPPEKPEAQPQIGDGPDEPLAPELDVLVQRR